MNTKNASKIILPKELFNQLPKLAQSYIQILEGVLKQQEIQIKQQEATIEQQQFQIECLQAQIDELKDRLSKNSSNSRKPPLKDSFSKIEKTKSLRQGRCVLE